VKREVYTPVTVEVSQQSHTCMHFVLLSLQETPSSLPCLLTSYTHIHSLTHTHTHTYTHTHTHTHTQMHTQTNDHAHTHIHTHTHARTCVYAHAHTQTHTHILTRTRTHIRTHAHARTHVHAHTHTCWCPPFQSPFTTPPSQVYLRVSPDCTLHPDVPLREGELILLMAVKSYALRTL